DILGLVSARPRGLHPSPRFDPTPDGGGDSAFACSRPHPAETSVGFLLFSRFHVGAPRGNPAARSVTSPARASTGLFHFLSQVQVSLAIHLARSYSTSKSPLPFVAAKLIGSLRSGPFCITRVSLPSVNRRAPVLVYVNPSASSLAPGSKSPSMYRSPMSPTGNLDHHVPLLVDHQP